MRLGRNLVSGIGGTLWGALVGLAMVPFYLHYLGIEAYGLVGFFLGLQAVFQVLDLGLAPTINREVARAQAIGEMASARSLLRTLSLFYWLVGTAIGAVIYLAAPWIGAEWLSAQKLSDTTVAGAIMLMGAVVGLRFPIGLYGGALLGAHRLAESSLINAVIATVTALGAIVVLRMWPTIGAFFAWQLVVAGCHVAIMRFAAWRALGGLVDARVRWDRVREIWRFSAGMGVVAALGMILVQLDKIVLSRAVTLEEFGSYTLAGMAARVLTLITAPVFGVIYPRLAAMVAIDDQAGLGSTYRIGTRLLVMVLMPIAVFVAVFAVELFTLWTGNPAVARSIEWSAAFLVLGTALNAIMIFPFALQLAYGNSRIPAVITAVLIIGFVPLLLELVPRFGIAGGAAAWALLNLAYVPLGAALTHRSLLKGQGWAWLLKDVVMPCAVAGLVVGGGAWLLWQLPLSPFGRVALGVPLIPVAFATILVFSPVIRDEATKLAARIGPFRRHLSNA